MLRLTLLKFLVAIAVGVAMYFMVHPYLLPFFWTPIAAAIAWRGDREAQMVAVLGPINLLVSALGPKLGLFPTLYQADQSRLGVLGVDAATALILLIIAVRSRRWWPSWIAAFELLMVASHLIFIFGHGLIQPWAYVSSIVIWTWFKYVLLSFVALDLYVAPDPRRLRSSAAPILLMIPMLGFLAISREAPPFYPQLWEGALILWILIVILASAWKRKALKTSGRC